MSPENSKTVATPASPDLASRRFWRFAAQSAVVIGAAGSVALMLKVGHRNQSIILMLLFAGWVLAPFVALAWVDRWPRFQGAPIGVILQVLKLLLSIGALCAYARVAFGPSLAQPAAPFLLVPLGSLVVIAITLLLAARFSR